MIEMEEDCQLLDERKEIDGENYISLIEVNYTKIEGFQGIHF